MRHFVVKDKKGDVISTIREQDADFQEGKITIAVITGNDTDKVPVDKDTYDKQKKSIAGVTNEN